ncbi:copper resistance protein CopC [Devosia sp. BK]|uniref:copper resistance CopC/CopD family protein n=1 Tax=Devosia sp. BK TaxID=2871706 RepID=UPI002939D4A6|nr:CopD family protein [Devosia sp. BK]MDV3252444.1 copper resistance protein CopC [Devosia sp. BK]
MIVMKFFARLVLGLALVFALAAPAFAHAQLIGSDPSDKAVLNAAPEALTLRFNEPVTPLAITLIDPQGGKTDLTAVTRGGERVEVPLADPLGEGTHVLSWRVTSIDGHPIGGALVFSVGAVTEAASVSQGDPVSAFALWASKTGLFVALFIGLGGALFRAIAEVPRRLERVLLGVTLAGLLLAPLSLGLHGLDALALPVADFFKPAAWRAALATSYGATALVLIGAFVLGSIAVGFPRSPVTSGLGVLAALLGALSLSLSGHAGAAEPQWLTRPAVFFHVGGILFWVGALLPLAVLLTAKDDRALARFSRVIPFAVGALLVSGVTLAMIQMGPPSPAWFSSYAAILAAKVGLLVVLFALALWNRFRLTRPALAGMSGARKHLRRSIIVETLLVVLILGLAAGWRFTPPPRALAEVQESEPGFVHAMNAEVMANVTISDAPGTARLDIALTDANYGAIEAQSVVAILSSETLGIAPIRAEAELTPEGWVVRDIAIPIPGTWTLTLEIRLSRFALAKIAADFDVE